MTEQYQTPDPDDTQGHVRRDDDDSTGDDTQGHFIRQSDDADTGDDDDVQGHVRH